VARIKTSVGPGLRIGDLQDGMNVAWALGLMKSYVCPLKGI